MRADLIVAARWVVTMRDGAFDEVLEHHSLVVDGGKIIAILPSKEAESAYEPDEFQKMDRHHVLMPGMVNAHSHSPMTLLRGYADDMPLMEWLTTKIFSC